MNTGILNSKLVIHLISMFDASKCSIKIKGVEHTMTAADFTDIMGVRDGDQQFNFSLRALDGLLGKFAEYEGGDEKKPYVCRKKVLDKLRNGDEIDAKRAYNLLALIRVLLPPGRQKLNIKYLDIIDHFENKPWATYAINDMVKCINAYKRGKANVQSHIGGCLLFLQLFYMNKVSLTPPNDTILLHYVTKEMVEKFVKEHEKEHESSSGSAPEGEKEIMEFEYEHIKTMIKGHMVNRVNNIEDQDRKNIVESLYKGILVAFEEHAAETLHHLAISASDHNGSSETHSSFHAEEVQLDDSTENEVDANVETENVAGNGDGHGHGHDVETENVDVVQQDVHDDFRRDGDGDVDDVQNKRSKKRRKNEAQVRGTYTMNLRSRSGKRHN